MGFIDKVKKFFTRSSKKQVANIINRYYGGDWQYFVWNYANQIYNIPEVKCAIEKIADIFSSVDIYNERVDKIGNVTYIEDATLRVLKYKPNPLQNSTQFYKNVITKLLLDNNVFIEPVFDTSGNLKALYPLPTKAFQLSKDNNNAYVQFYDAYKNPQEKYNLDDIIYLNRFNTLSGGQQTNDMGLYEKVLQSLSEKIVNDASPNKPRALLQSNQVGEGQLKDRDKKGATETLKARLKRKFEIEARQKFPGEEKQQQREKFVKEQMREFGNLVMEVSDGTREGLFRDAKVFKKAKFAGLMIKIAELGLYLCNMTKQEFIKKVSERSGMSPKEIIAFLKALESETILGVSCKLVDYEFPKD